MSAIVFRESGIALIGISCLIWYLYCLVTSLRIFVRVLFSVEIYNFKPNFTVDIMDDNLHPLQYANLPHIMSITDFFLLLNLIWIRKFFNVWIGAIIFWSRITWNLHWLLGYYSLVSINNMVWKFPCSTLVENCFLKRIFRYYFQCLTSFWQLQWDDGVWLLCSKFGSVILLKWLALFVSSFKR